MSQNKELLAEHLANLALLHMALKGAYRATKDHAVAASEHAAVASEFAHILKKDAATKDARYRKAADAANDYASRWAKSTYDRKKGWERANAPKQKAKAEALELWKERNLGKHKNLRTVAQFATEVMRRWPILTSQKVVEGWSAKWTKAVKAGETPVC